MRNTENEEGGTVGHCIGPILIRSGCLGFPALVPCFLLLPNKTGHTSTNMGVSDNRAPEYSTLHSRILIIRTPK